MSNRLLRKIREVWRGIAVIIVLIAALMSCAGRSAERRELPSSQPAASSRYPMRDGYPVWYYNPGYGGLFGEVGSAGPAEGGDLARQERTAYLKARGDLIKKFMVMIRSECNESQKSSVVNGVVKDFVQKIDCTTIEHISLPLDYTRIQDRWVNPKTGELFLWVVLDP